jgi:hypothetical protein
VTVVLAVASAFLVGVGGWRLWVVHRDLEGLRSGLDRRTDRRVDAHLAAAWEELGRLQGAHVQGVDARVERAEAAAAHIANGHAQLDQRLVAVDRRLVTVEDWVRVWAGQAGR